MTLNRTLSTLLLSTLALGGAGSAFANTTGPLTREQVRAEYFQAVRAGDIYEVNTGYLAKQLRPSDTASRLTREDVRAEYARAVRAGEIYEVNTLRKQNELAPQRYQVQAAASPLSREEVQAEAISASRAGTLPMFLGS